MRVRNRSVVVAVMAAFMVFGAVTPALAQGDGAAAPGSCAVDGSKAAGDCAGGAEAVTQDRKWH